MPRALIVDDIEENLLYLDALLRGNGFRVASARNGAEALASARGAPPDLIVSDILMPVMDGYALCREIKEDARLAAIPFVFYTATYVDAKDEALGLKLGAARYVIKPQEPEALMAIFRDVLAEARPGRAPASATPAGELDREHHEAVARKLEKKMLDLGRTEVERDRLEADLRAAQKMEAIGSLAGGIAHDFNNLLSVILSHSELALEAMDEKDPAREDLLNVVQAGRRAAALTRQLLAFGRKQLMQPVPLNLNQTVDGMEGMLRRLLGEDVELRKVLAPDLGVVVADAGQMEQVLMNLVANARDAMPRGGTLTLETANVELDEGYAANHVAVRAGAYVMLAVSDTGLGMDRATRERIFEPFFTTKEKGRGTGLGLSTVHGIVAQSGGNVWVYSEPGRGTTFKVYLPRRPAGAAVPAGAGARRGAPTGGGGTETVLVVEDEEVLIQLASRALVTAGFKVLTARDGEDGLRTAAQYPGEIHLLATDVIMPRMGGQALATALARARPGIKVLFMSGYTADAIHKHGVLESGTNLIAKPFTTTELARKVREVLDQEGAEGSVTGA